MNSPYNSARPHTGSPEVRIEDAILADFGFRPKRVQEPTLGVQDDEPAIPRGASMVGGFSLTNPGINVPVIDPLIQITERANPF